MSEYLPPVGVEPPSWQEIAEAMARGRDEARRELTEAEASHQAEIARLQSLNAMLGANVDALDAEVGRLRAELDAYRRLSIGGSGPQPVALNLIEGTITTPRAETTDGS